MLKKLFKKDAKIVLFKEDLEDCYHFHIYKTERKTHPSLLYGWDVSD